MVQPVELGSASKPLEAHAERLHLVERTSDPASTQEGEMWLRSDIAPKTEQIGTVRFDNGGSTIGIPVFATGTAGENVSEAFRVQVGGATGFAPITDGNASYPQLRIQHNGTPWEMHDALSASAIRGSGVFRYPFNNNNNDTSIADDPWNGFDGTVNGAAFDSSGGIDGTGAYVFDGVDDYIRSPSNTFTTFSGTDPVSFAAWVYPDVLDGNWAWLAGLNSQTATNGIGEFGPRVNSDGTVRFFASGNDFTSNATVPSGSYSHLAMTMASDGTLTGYIDGSLVGTASSSSYDQVDVWDVGSPRFDGWDGRIDEPRLYIKTLSDTEVNNLYNTGSISG